VGEVTAAESAGCSFQCLMLLERDLEVTERDARVSASGCHDSNCPQSWSLHQVQGPLGNTGQGVCPKDP
jgi:hypothetical protein